MLYRPEREADNHLHLLPGLKLGTNLYVFGTYSIRIFVRIPTALSGFLSPSGEMPEKYLTLDAVNKASLKTNSQTKPQPMHNGTY